MKLIGFLLVLFVGMSGLTFGQQYIEEIETQFWDAVDNKNDSLIVQNGEILIDFIERNNYKIDSGYIDIELYTAISFASLNNQKKSNKILIKTLSHIENLFDKKCSYYSFTLNEMAFNYSKLRNYNKAIEYNSKALEINEKLFGKEHFRYVESLHGMANNYYYSGDYNKSLECHIQALKIFKNILGKEHFKYLGTLNSIGLCYTELANFNKSLEYHIQALSIKEKTLGKVHSSYATSLNNIALNYSYTGDNKIALDYYFRALKIIEEIFGENNPKNIRTLRNIANTYGAIGYYNKALEYSLKALKISEEVFGKNNPEFSTSLKSISSSYTNLGFYKKSLKYQLQALLIDEKTLGKEHPVYATALNNIALNYFNLGDYNKSLVYNLRALSIREKTLGKFHSSYATSLNNIALNYSRTGDNKKALDYYFQALKINEKLFGKLHHTSATYLNNIAHAYSVLGNYKKSLKYNLQAIHMLENYNRENQKYVISLGNIACNYFCLGKHQKTYQLSNKSFISAYKFFSKNKAGLSYTETVKYKKKVVSVFARFASAKFYYPDSIDNLFLNWVKLNGMLSAEDKKLKSSIENSNNNKLKASFEELVFAKRQMNMYNQKTKKELEINGIDVPALQEKIEALEREISNESKAFKNFTREISSSDICKLLKKDEVYVDMACFQLYDFENNRWNDSSAYYLFIHDSNDTLVDYVLIEDGSSLDGDVYDDYKKATTKAISEIKNPNFYNRLWKPIADKIGDAKKVYISLGGVYNKINLNTIYNPNTGKYLMDELDIQIVNSARDFVLMKEKEQKKYKSNVAALFGYPDFDSNQIEEQTEEEFSYSRDLASFWTDSLNRGGHGVDPLPGTKTEVETIEATMSKNNWEVRSFMQEQASESNFKKQHSPRVLHVATHGYFFKDIPMENDQMRFMGMDRERVVQDPMLRSGLLLAGANKALAGAESERENGLLSASEASLLDLSETELVVLSACETGRGEIKNSEGVYGLRKAFSNAGAENTIMSLWKVDDKVTQEFMTTFYTYWLEDKMPIREAFKSTRSFIKSKYPQPYYWGAFILVGR